VSPNRRLSLTRAAVGRNLRSKSNAHARVFAREQLAAASVKDLDGLEAGLHSTSADPPDSALAGLELGEEPVTIRKEAHRE